MKQYEFNFQMVSGCSTLVQFQAVHEIRALHYNQLKAALPSFKMAQFLINNMYFLFYKIFLKLPIFSYFGLLKSFHKTSYNSSHYTCELLGNKT